MRPPKTNNEAITAGISEVQHGASHTVASRKLKPGSIPAQLSRQRRKDGMRCINFLEIRDCEIDALIKRRLLSSAARSDREAIKSALYQHLDATLS